MKLIKDMSEAAGSNKPMARDVPSRRETLGEALTSMFAGSGNGLLDALTLAVGIVSLGWLADSMLPLLNDTSPMFKEIVGKLWVGLTETHLFRRIQVHSLSAATRSRC